MTGTDSEIWKVWSLDLKCLLKINIWGSFSMLWFFNVRFHLQSPFFLESSIFPERFSSSVPFYSPTRTSHWSFLCRNLLHHKAVPWQRENIFVLPKFWMYAWARNSCTEGHPLSVRMNVQSDSDSFFLLPTIGPHVVEIPMRLELLAFKFLIDRGDRELWKFVEAQWFLETLPHSYSCGMCKD